MRDVWLGCLVQARESKCGEREDSKDISGWGLGRAKLAAVFLLFIAVEVGVWGLWVSPLPGQSQLPGVGAGASSLCFSAH